MGVPQSRSGFDDKRYIPLENLTPAVKPLTMTPLTELSELLSYIQKKPY
jgi:hypothetical protein